MTVGFTPSGSHAPRDLSQRAQACATWLKLVARGLKTCRLYRPGNPIATHVRQQLFDRLSLMLSAQGAWRLRIESEEMWLDDEPVIRPTPAGFDSRPRREEQLPGLLHRDGVRTICLTPGMPRRDFDVLFDALLSAGSNPRPHDDLVTSLWQAGTGALEIESAPGPSAESWDTSGAEGRPAPSDDWPLPAGGADVTSAFEELRKQLEPVRDELISQWEDERARHWTDVVPELFRRLLAADGGPETRRALAGSVLTWLGGAIQRAAWHEARGAFQLLREVDPDGTVSDEPLASLILGFDMAELTERLDEAAAEEQAQCFALAVAIGRPALHLICEVMARAGQARTRVTACTMLCYLCADRPELLAPYFSDSRWYVVRNAVFVLGQIGGSEAVALLHGAALHAEPRVRRQVVQSLNRAPRAQSLSILLEQLGTRDLHLLNATLNILGRERDPVVAAALLRRIDSPDFETRREDNQRALFDALAEVADESILPTLEALLHRGGWFARPLFQRTAAAQTLARLPGPGGRALLEAGTRSPSEVVREVCLDALSTRAT